MSKLTDYLKTIADAIRSKKGTTDKINASNFASEIESIESGGGTPIELATNEEMQAVLVSKNVGKIYKFVGATTETYTNGNLYQVIEED